MASGEDVQNLPVMPGGVSTWPLVRDVARVGYGATVGEYDRYNIQRMVTLTANVVGEDLGRTAARVDAALQRAGSPPRGA
jgi:multidrug efflux pump subunit AcrB